ncbi:hypothetical protein DWY99_04075 [[Clostridium] leptum]|uniref:HAD family hydrolase n=1 Tax=[Clostridium] leptum TaxID=1535 RepID=A0A412AYP5_9FIRM|nr:hypothetical protein DWY99_04075 [[Clostridium] leptum]
MTEFCIFDLDGTLLDTLEDLAVSVNYALEKNGLPQHPIDSYRYFVGDGVLTLIRRASGSGDEGLVKALKADFDRHYNVHRFDRTSLMMALGSFWRRWRKGISQRRCCPISRMSLWEI